MRIIRINKGRAVNLPLRLIGVGLALASMFFLMKNLPLPWSILSAILISSFLPAIWFSFHVIIIDNEKKEIFDGIWTMGRRIGKPIYFDKIEELYIKKVKTEQTVYSLPNKENLVVDHTYEALLRINSGEEFYLICHPIKERVEEKAAKIRKKLGMI